MSFTTITFLFYALPCALVLYYFFPKAQRQSLMIVLSLCFYGWNEPYYVVGLIALVCYVYGFGRYIDACEDKKRRRLRCVIACSFLLFLLIYFKYYETFLYAFTQFIQSKSSFEHIIMPLGLSFVLFQALSYLIDLYRGKVSANEFRMCACYITFFPKLLMGPIMPYHMFKAKNQAVECTAASLEIGCKRFVLGLAQKVILADTLSLLHQQLLLDQSMLGSWLSSLAYTLQIFFDFNGYSLMAMAIASMFGYELMENFHQPYLATSVKDFWRRWHISLSQWFRDYVYIPLGGNRKGKKRQIINLLIVWSLTGLWHGSTLNFFIWGLYYALLLLVETYLLPTKNIKSSKWGSHFITLLLVHIGWVIFANQDLMMLAKQLLSMIGFGTGLASAESIFYAKSYLGFIIIAILVIFPIKQTSMKKRLDTLADHELIVTFMYTALFLISICFLIASGVQGFLYFQF